MRHSESADEESGLRKDAIAQRPQYDSVVTYRSASNGAVVTIQSVANYSSAHPVDAGTQDNFRNRTAVIWPFTASPPPANP